MKPFIRIFVLSILIFIISKHVNAQNCAAKSKKDAFTGAKIVESDDVKVYGALLDQNDRGYLLSFQLREDSIYLCFETSGKFMEPAAFKTVMVKFSDNSILTFNDFVEAGPVTAGDYTYDKSYCKINKQILLKLGTTSITDLRFEMMPARPNRTNNPLMQAASQQQQNSFNAIDNSLGSGKAKKVMKNATCMLLYL